MTSEQIMNDKVRPMWVKQTNDNICMVIISYKYLLEWLDVYTINEN